MRWLEQALCSHTSAEHVPVTHGKLHREGKA